MHEGFVIPVKFDVEYLNWLLKPTSTLKYFKGTSTWNQPFYCLKSAPLSPRRISNPPPTLKTVLPPVSEDRLKWISFVFGSFIINNWRIKYLVLSRNCLNYWSFCLSCIFSECIEVLLMHGATILVHDSVTKRTPLHASGNGARFLKSLKNAQ